MIKLLVLTLLVSLPTSLWAQKGSLTRTENDVVFGAILKTGQTLKGTRYTFDNRIHKCTIDSASHLAALQFRGIAKNGKYLESKGYISSFDLNTQQILWSRKVNYQFTSVSHKPSSFLLTDIDESICIDLHSGQDIFSFRKHIYYQNDKYRVALGYGTNGMLTSAEQTLVGYDLQNTQVLWKRKLTREYTWNDAYHIDDSTLMVVSSGLHTVNLRTGKGWDYDAITGSKDYTKAGIINGLGIGLGILTGTFVMATGHDVVSDLVSNVVTDSASYYLASQDKLACLDHSGKEKWVVPLPKEMASSSILFKKDSALILINKGSASFGRRTVPAGKVFLASYSLQNGKSNFFITIEQPKAQLTDISVTADTIFLSTKTDILKASLKDGSILATKENIVPEKEEIHTILSKRKLYTALNDSVYRNIAQTDSSFIPIYTSQGKVLLIDAQLNIKQEKTYNDFYIAYLQKDGLTFISNKDKTIVLNKNGIAVAELKASRSAWLQGDILYETHDNTLNAINIKPLRKM
ncbi:MAG: hypothetical protein Q8909_18710 [Bacteroidota bacterium]|nr:hypothetical protein [Bacteroidota bacterium]